MNPALLAAMLTLTAAMTACDTVEGLLDDAEPLNFTAQGSEIIVEGEIGSDALDRFRDVYNANPQADTLVLRWIGGSVDDDANLAFSSEVRKLGLVTRVPSDGLVASGGTDLFLAGTKRSVDPGACIGVHSWSGDGIEGKNVPRTDPAHRPYLSYYATMGIPAAFYWYTLEAAPADSMHWMTARDVNSFGLTTAPARDLSAAATCDQR